MLVYGFLLNEQEYKDLTQQGLLSYACEFKNKIYEIYHNGNYYVGFLVDKLLVNPHVELPKLYNLIKKYYKKTCDTYNLN